MISESNMWIIRHQSGRYLRSDVKAIGCGSMGYEHFSWLVADPFSASALYRRVPWDNMFSEPKPGMPQTGWHLVAEQFDIVRRPGCKCCGDSDGPLHIDLERDYVDHPSIRCAKHIDRNPCAIEGCSRTTGLNGSVRTTDAWLCPDHWRRFCPPRSARRRAYHRFFAKAKKMGIGKGQRWPDDLEASYWRFWETLIGSARARHAAGGTIDQDEINKLFGWEA
jgi:hypothetical protein